MKRIGCCLAIGAAAGAVNGLFGAGGGAVLVPLLTGILRFPPRRAMATALAVMLPLSASSLIVYAAAGNVPFGAAWPYLIGGAAGGLAAGLLLRRAPATGLRRLFGALVLFSGVRAVWAL